jgi:protein MpaA
VGDVKLSVALFNDWFAKDTYKINVPQPPSVQAISLSEPMSVTTPLNIVISSNDSIFDYQIEIDSKVASCPVKDLKISCDIASLNLLQGKVYSAKLFRMFGGKKVATIASRDITTVSATTVVSSSISQDQIIYDNTKIFSFEFDKNVIQGNITLEKVVGTERTLVPITFLFSDKTANVTVTGDWDRDTSYEFTIDRIEAQDNSSLAAPYKLGFVMSDGPIVISVSTDAVGAPFSQTIALTFDQVLSTDQDINNFVSTSGISTSISRSGNKVYVSYSNAPLCTDMNIYIKPGLLSNQNIIQDNSWSFSMRTICHTTSVIGYSVLGRPILAYIFGNGSTAILFTGGIHGNEPSGSYIMYDFISYLESNVTKIPGNKKIVIVPEVNPDGIAAFSRYNSNNVNIDRNFPSANWVTDIDSAGGLVLGGGGVSALSEPETRALADLTTSLQPRLEVSFHSQGSLIGTNQRGDSIAIGNMYASSVGYGSMIGYAEETMGYTITGEYEEWAGEQYGTPAILIELPSLAGQYFWAHQPILWAIVNI